MGEGETAEPTERVARTFSLSEWATLASQLLDGMPLPAGVERGSYTVELVDRVLTDADNTHAPGEIVSQQPEGLN